MAKPTPVTPLHVATAGGHLLRFFRTPLEDGLPDMPWVAVDDLGRCAGLNRDDRRTHRRLFDVIKITRTVATPKGPVKICPHALARCVVEAMISMGRAPASARDDYVNASADAIMKLLHSRSQVPRR